MKVESVKFKVGIIGCGSMASYIDDQVHEPHRGGLVKPYAHAAGFANVDQTQMVAACNHTEPKLRAFQEKWNVPRGYTDYRDLIDKEILAFTSHICGAVRSSGRRFPIARGGCRVGESR